MSLTYAEYLKLEEILSLQSPQSDGPEHDEMLYIVAHQVYELWFKEILHELDFFILRLKGDEVSQALHILKRILTILKVQVAQMDILETMTPFGFKAFRDRLETASTIQSFQFREIEFVLGLKEPDALACFPDGSEARSRLEARLTQPSLWDAFLQVLNRSGYPIPQEVLSRDVSKPTPSSPEVQNILHDVYRHDPTHTRICERLVDMDEGLQEWRYRHVKMVERTIGVLFGTDGTSGLDFLKTTLMKPAFPDLWAIRSRL